MQGIALELGLFTKLCPRQYTPNRQSSSGLYLAETLPTFLSMKFSFMGREKSDPPKTARHLAISGTEETRPANRDFRPDQWYPPPRYVGFRPEDFRWSRRVHILTPQRKFQGNSIPTSEGFDALFCTIFPQMPSFQPPCPMLSDSQRPHPSEATSLTPPLLAASAKKR